MGEQGEGDIRSGASQAAAGAVRQQVGAGAPARRAALVCAEVRVGASAGELQGLGQDWRNGKHLFLRLRLPAH